MAKIRFLIGAALVVGASVPACSGGSGPSGSPGTAGATGEDGGTNATSGSQGGGSGGGAVSNGDSGTSGGGALDASLPAQCSDLAAAACKQLSQCDAIDMKTFFGGDVSACTAQMLSLCPTTSAPGTSNTPSSIAACASAITQLASCAAWFDYLYRLNQSPYLEGFDLLCPTAPGTLATGAACEDDSQCSSGSCGPAADAGASSCGACAAPAGSSPCEEAVDCAAGQLCNANGSCVAPGAAGAPCDSSDPASATQPCSASLYCKFPATDAGTTPDGGALGACAALGTTGQPCNPDADVNDCADGLFCKAGACTSIQFVAVGAACDDVGLLCTGAACLFLGDAGATGACTKYAAEGGGCQVDGYGDDNCPFDADCVNGTCTTATAGSCP